jgi:L-2,4-diaminobutyrate decarboxylase
MLPDSLPETGIGDSAALDTLAPTVLDASAQLHHPGYFAHMDPPTPAITWAASLWQVATNQNLLHPDAAPAARSLTEQVVNWLAPSFGMSGGHFVPGSTIANLTALWAARQLKQVTRIAASEKSHLSIRKSAEILGLKYIVLPTNSRHEIDISGLTQLDRTALVLTAGTVATGVIDPLNRPDDAAWVHVDAAWSGPLRLTDRFTHCLDGIETADSVGFSAHKWLYQPKGSALVLFRNSDAAHDALSYGGGYLATPNIGLLGSTPAAAVPLAAMLLSWGRTGLGQRIESDMTKADQLAGLIESDPRFLLWGPNQTGVVVWRPVDAAASDVRNRLENGWVSLTEVDGQTWFRSVAANPSADPNYLFDQVSAAL